MDLSKSRWSKYLPAEKIHDTPKLYYGKYFYRLEFKFPGAWLVRNLRLSEHELLSQLKKAMKVESDRYYGSFHKLVPLIKEKDFDGIVAMFNAIKSVDKTKCRVRIEGHHIRVFAIHAEDLMPILTASPLAKLFVKELHQPSDMSSVSLLSEGTIFQKTKPKHSYKVTIRSGKYSPEIQKQIKEYMKNFPDDIFLSGDLKWRLGESKPSIYRSPGFLTGFFHVKDPSVLTFLALISPSFVQKVNKLEQIVAK